jgi:hypothetical protein
MPAKRGRRTARRSRKSDSSDTKFAFAVAGTVGVLIFWSAASWATIVCAGVCLVVVAAIAWPAFMQWAEWQDRRRGHGAAWARAPAPRAARAPARSSGRSQRNHQAEGVCWSSDYVDELDPNAAIDSWRWQHRPHWTGQRAPAEKIYSLAPDEDLSDIAA